MIQSGNEANAPLLGNGLPRPLAKADVLPVCADATTPQLLQLTRVPSCCLPSAAAPPKIGCMPVYFLHIRRGKDVVVDEEGVELPDLQAAREEALASVRDIVAEDVRTQRPVDLRDRIEITDAQGRVLLNVAFSEAIPRNGKR